MRLRPQHVGELCDSARCPEEYQVVYLSGATPFNAGRDVRLCDRHLNQWVEETQGTKEMRAEEAV